MYRIQYVDQGSHIFQIRFSDSAKLYPFRICTVWPANTLWRTTSQGCKQDLVRLQATLEVKRRTTLTDNILTIGAIVKTGMQFNSNRNFRGTLGRLLGYGCSNFRTVGWNLERMKGRAARLLHPSLG